MRDRFRLTTLDEVLARRELEQEAALVEKAPLQLTRCRAGCGRGVSDVGGHDTCAKCRKRRLRPVDPLPEIEPIPVFEVTVAKDEAKTCSRPGCGKPLRSDNTKGVCSVMTRCGSAEQPKVPPENLDEDLVEATPPARKAKRAPLAKSDATKTLERFRLLAEALGFDPDEVLARFAEGWLERARNAVDFVSPKSRPALVVGGDVVAHDD